MACGAWNFDSTSRPISSVSTSSCSVSSSGSQSASTGRRREHFWMWLIVRIVSSILWTWLQSLLNRIGMSMSMTSHGETVPAPGFNACLRASLLLRLGLFEEAGVEGARQEVAHLEGLGVAAQVCEDDGDVAAVLPDDLAAGSAGRRQALCVDDDGEARELALPFGERLPDGDALGADGLLVGRALDVAARINFAADGFERRADAEVRVARQRALARVRGLFD